MTPASRSAPADERPLQVAQQAVEIAVDLRRGPRAAGRSRPGRCGCGRCGACGRRRRGGRSAPARCACGCLRAPGGTRTGRRRSRWPICFQAGDDLVPFVVGEQADLGQHVGVGDRAADVVGVEPAVEADAFGELLDAAVRRLVKHTTPGLICHVDIRRDGCGRRETCRRREKYANMFTVNTLRRGVNEPGAGEAQKIGSGERIPDVACLMLDGGRDVWG